MEEDTDIRIPEKGIYIALVAAVIAACAFAFFVSALVAVWILVAVFFIYGCAYMVLPRGTVPQVRSRFFDAGCCFAFSIALAVFAQWATTAQIV